MLSSAETQYLLPFIGRSDLFAEQHPNGAWTPVRRHVTDEDIADHLAGRRTIGFYVVDPAGTVRSAVLDIDVPKEIWERGDQETELSANSSTRHRKLWESVHVLYGAAPLVEVSGRKGLHVWIPYRRRVDARIARLGCERVLADAGFRLGARNHWIARRVPGRSHRALSEAGQARGR